MPTLKTLNGRNKYFNPDARELVARYILNPWKSPNGYCGGIDTGNGDNMVASIVAQMDAVARHFHKEYGVQLRHFVVSYTPNETDEPVVVNCIAQQVAEWLSERYQTIYAVHEDTENLHFHMMFNSVSYVDGYKYHGNRKDHYKLIQQIKDANHLFGIHGLTCVSNTSDEDIQ